MRQLCGGPKWGARTVVLRLNLVNGDLFHLFAFRFREVGDYLKVGDKLVLKARKALGEDDYLSAGLASALEGPTRSLLLVAFAP